MALRRVVPKRHHAHAREGAGCRRERAGGRSLLALAGSRIARESQLQRLTGRYVTPAPEQLVASVAYALHLFVREPRRFGDGPAGMNRALRRDVALGVRMELLGRPGGRVATLGVEEADDQLDLERVGRNGAARPWCGEVGDIPSV